VVKDGERKHILSYDVTFFDIHSTKLKQFGCTLVLNNGKKLTFLGDEPYNPVCERYIRGTDWLLHEAFCLYVERDIWKPYEKHHSTVKDACELAEAMGIPNLTMAPNEIKTLTYDIYTGPKFNAYLRDLNLSYPAISDIMAYGWLVFLSVPMNWLLNLFHGWFGNWGVAIICMTIVVRALIWPLHKKSYMAMKRMSLVQPEMVKLKEKYPDDPQKVNMEMMKLYQKYGT